MSRHYRRTDLFLLRIWTEDAALADGAQGGRGGRAGPSWRGRVQRLVDGEAHQFGDWPELIDLLVAMLAGSDAQGHPRRPTENRTKPEGTEGEG